MRFIDTINFARSNVGRTRLRTALTATGIAIGTAAVVTLLALGNGIQAIAVGQAASFSAVTSVLVYPGANGTDPRPITPANIATFRTYGNVKSVVTSLNTPALRFTVGGKSVTARSDAKSPIADGATMLSGGGGGSMETDGVIVPKSLLSGLGQTPLSIVGKSITLTEGGDICCTDPNRLSISAAADASLAGLDFRARHVAETPDQRGLLAALDAILAERRRG